jgi:bis(5'-nucleosyl)-tetraphosphatase (symmetrical)
MKKINIIIGDIHGCIQEFKELLKLIEYNSSHHRLVLAGDLMDRGEDPIACIRLARELKIESVMGNHEDNAIRWRKNDAIEKAGGRKNRMRVIDEKTRRERLALSGDDIEWIEKLPLTIHIMDNIHLVHGGLEANLSFSDQRKDKLIRTRYVSPEGKSLPLQPDKSAPPNSFFWSEIWKGPESFVYGHAVHSLTDPRIDRHSETVVCYGIDTGCVFGGRLTALVLDGKETFVQVQAKAVYAPFLRE